VPDDILEGSGSGFNQLHLQITALEHFLPLIFSGYTMKKTQAATHHARHSIVLTSWKRLPVLTHYSDNA
jgi:hypothetical protein